MMVKQMLNDYKLSWVNDGWLHCPLLASDFPICSTFVDVFSLLRWVTSQTPWRYFLSGGEHLRMSAILHSITVMDFWWLLVPTKTIVANHSQQNNNTFCWHHYDCLPTCGNRLYRHWMFSLCSFCRFWLVSSFLVRLKTQQKTNASNNMCKWIDLTQQT